MKQELIDELLQCLKVIDHEYPYFEFPDKGDYKSLNIRSEDYSFIVDINRKGRKKPQFTLQLRGKSFKDYPLLRLDIFGPPHINPEGNFPYAGQQIPCPHIHIAQENYAAKIAYPLNEEYAKMYLTENQLLDLIEILQKFLIYCKVGNTDTIRFRVQEELF